MSAQTVLIVGGRPEIVHKAAKLGLRVVYLQHKHLFKPDVGELVEVALLTDFTDWSRVRPLLAGGAAQAFDITGVAAFTELALEPAGQIAEMLGLPHTPPDVHRLLREKAVMREHLANVGADNLAAAVVTDRERLAAFGRDQGYPFVVKPTNGAASLGVLRVDGPEQLDDAWQHIARMRGKDFKPYSIDHFLMEEYADGPEYSVEGFTFDGRHVILAVTEKVCLENYMEVGHAMPARLDPATEEAVVGAVTSFLDAVGVEQGPTHTEVRISSRGPRVIESHTRAGGDRIPELMDAAYGIDQEEYALGWQFGLLPTLESRPQPRCAAATRFLTAEPGTIVEIRGIEEVLANPDVLMLDLPIKVGDVVRPLVRYADRLGQVVVTGTTTAAALETSEKLINTIKVSTV